MSTGQTPRTRVVADFDLGALVPKGQTFSYPVRGVDLVYQLPGDPSIEFLLEALQLRRIHSEAQQAAQEAQERLLAAIEVGDVDQAAQEEEASEIASRAAVESLERMRSLFHELLDEGGSTPEQPYPRLGAETIGQVFVIAMGGDPRVGSLEQHARGVYTGEEPTGDAVGLGEGDPLPPTPPAAEEPQETTEQG